MSDGIDKRNGGDLWAEIRRLYESEAAPTYAKIKAILMAEFNLSSFPIQQTVSRRAKKENWQRSGGNATARTYDDAFWEAVKTVYESHVSIGYSELKELVQNALQIDYFPTSKAVNERKNKEGWKPLEDALNLDDKSIKNLKNELVTTTSIIDDYLNKYKKGDQQSTDLEAEMVDDYDSKFSKFSYFGNKMQSNIEKKNNLFMSATLAKLEQVEFIEQSRFRLAKSSIMGDELHDALARYYAAMSDPDFISILDRAEYKVMNRMGEQLTRIINAFSILSATRTGIIKAEFASRGLFVEDCRDDITKEKYVPGQDPAEIEAFEAQRQRLRQEIQDAQNFRDYIESGQLEEEVERQIAEATAQDDIQEEDYIDFEEVEDE